MDIAVQSLGIEECEGLGEEIVTQSGYEDPGAHMLKWLVFCY